jgi:hypothetical protein
VRRHRGGVLSDRCECDRMKVGWREGSALLSIRRVA